MRTGSYAGPTSGSGTMRAMSRAAPTLVLPLLLVLVLGTACSTPFRGPQDDALTFAQMQSLNRGVSADWVIAEYPFARNVQRRANGTIAQMGYLVADPLDDTQTLVLFFDQTGVMTHKQYSGPIVRPPEQQ